MAQNRGKSNNRVLAGEWKKPHFSVICFVQKYRIVQVEGLRSACRDNKRTLMKRLISLSIIGLAVAFCAGCVVTSICPYYTAKDVVFDAALVGVWAEAGSTNVATENWAFEKSGTNAYKFTVSEKDKHTEYEAHLFKLKGKVFMDCFPRERQGD